MTRARIAPLLLLVLLGAGAVGLALAARQTGQVVEEQRAERAALGDASAPLDAGPSGARDAAIAPRPVAPDDPYACVLPAIEIPQDPRCAAGEPYPGCRWQLPDDAAAAGLYVVWRSTTPDHRWARPGLVTLVMAAAREYQRRWPGEHLTIGDLDAAGPRHQTHDRGVDVDLYLEHAMLDVNAGPRQYLDNYAGRPAAEVADLRARVTDLAHILATCSGGRLRIYYNDPEVLRPFLAWFDAHGFVSDVGPAMTMHNRLHRFHFHMTVPEDLPPLGVGAGAP